jgi:hypothetical protein
VATLDDLLAGLRDAAGAEFAFALTRDGELVTRDAPRDMPEPGRTRLVRAALSLRRREVSALSLPRGELVPFGGPLPVDVSFAVAGDKLVCVVMTSSESRADARAAIEAALRTIDAPSTPPPKPAVRSVENSAPLLELRGTALLGRETLAAIELEVAQREAPLITLGPAPRLGRETLAAIDRDIDQHDAPQITVEVARKIGRETLAAIDKEVAVSGPPAEPAAIPPEVRRRTMPWVEMPLEKTNGETG